jgi:hypothetical protein
MTQGRDVMRLRFAICTGDDLFGRVAGEISAAFDGDLTMHILTPTPYMHT